MNCDETKKFSCELCEYATNFCSNWKKHTHSKKHTLICKLEKKYYCSLCGKPFTNTTSLKYHEKNICEKSKRKHKNNLADDIGNENAAELNNKETIKKMKETIRELKTKIKTLQELLNSKGIAALECANFTYYNVLKTIKNNIKNTPQRALISDIDENTL